MEGEFESVDVKNVSPELVEQLDQQIGKAINDVRLGRCGKAAVSITFDVGLDEDGEAVVGATQKDGRVAKQSWKPTAEGQGRLRLDAA